MTVANGYLGKREFHGPLAKSPYKIAPVVCRGPCGQVYSSSCEIMDDLCHGCWSKGYRIDPDRTVRRRLELVGKL